MEAQPHNRTTIRFPILYQILLAMSAVALVPIVGLWYISVYQSTQEWGERVSQGLVESADALGYSVEQWSRMNLRALEQNAETPAMLSMDSARQNPVLKTISETYPWIYLAFTVAPNGDNVGRSDGKPSTFYGDRDYFQQVIGGAPLGQQVLLGKTSKKPALILAKSIQGSDNGTKGVIAIAMTLEDLSRTVTKTRIGKTGYAILLDKDNRLIAHGDGKVSSELQDLSTHPALRKDVKAGATDMSSDYQGREVVAFSKPLSNGWTLIVQQDRDEAYAAANAALRNALLLLGATLLAAVVFALLLARRLSAPIRRLTAIADDISRGNLNAEVSEVSRDDEIGALAKGIERMRVSLQMAFDRLRKR
ncbi:HAMP domain-containing protein [Thiorhodococcus mannitoliphagus]|uniref:histidine kinase n=1 Tax=Thiorhodococcus mannitoliphagus TaxID=329406 RepID=A0A6P1DQ56_9GAMM|nr:cache and HAMP domain-containing protein [Thiorhodococcus mannitoliphagus]NEX20407.1 HAMP domain-containing protein [Thiorhodococcus mannitoliphagus]